MSHAVAPRLFLIQRREVEPDGTRKPIDGMFFIMEGKVFAAPSLYEIMKTRLVSHRPRMAADVDDRVAKRIVPVDRKL